MEQRLNSHFVYKKFLVNEKLLKTPFEQVTFQLNAFEFSFIKPPADKKFQPVDV